MGGKKMQSKRLLKRTAGGLGMRRPPGQKADQWGGGKRGRGQWPLCGARGRALPRLRRGFALLLMWATFAQLRTSTYTAL